VLGEDGTKGQTLLAANKNPQLAWHAKQQKNLHLCRADAFENPLFSEGASRPDYGSHYRVGLQAPDDCKCLAPCGYSTGSSKVPSITNTAEVQEAASDFIAVTVTRNRVIRKRLTRLICNISVMSRRRS
jgi:hypothetical protein